MKKKAIIMTLITLLSLVITVGLRIAMGSSDVEYEEVKVTVVSSETVTHTVRVNGSRSQYNEYDVRVSYGGKIYDLKNCHNTYSYREGSTVTAYLANGKLYANTEGVESSTPLATAYFVFLFATFGMILGFPIYLSSQAQKKKKAA